MRCRKGLGRGARGGRSSAAAAASSRLPWATSRCCPIQFDGPTSAAAPAVQPAACPAERGAPQGCRCCRRSQLRLGGRLQGGQLRQQAAPVPEAAPQPSTARQGLHLALGQPPRGLTFETTLHLPSPGPRLRPAAAGGQAGRRGGRQAGRQAGKPAGRQVAAVFLERRCSRHRHAHQVPGQASG